MKSGLTATASITNNRRNTLLVAWDDNHLIGNGDALPWHIKEDMQLFKQRTMGHSIVMGRKTWDSLGHKPLPGRENIVISKTLDCRAMPDGSVSVPDIPTALEIAFLAKDNNEIFTIGGSQIYEFCLRENLINRMIVTHVYGSHEGDVYFPKFDENDWVKETSLLSDKFQVVEYNRK
jgi:dihydrofolate reductase